MFKSVVVSLALLMGMVVVGARGLPGVVATGEDGSTISLYSEKEHCPDPFMFMQYRSGMEVVNGCWTMPSPDVVFVILDDGRRALLPREVFKEPNIVRN